MSWLTRLEVFTATSDLCMLARLTLLLQHCTGLQVLAVITETINGEVGLVLHCSV